MEAVIQGKLATNMKWIMSKAIHESIQVQTTGLKPVSTKQQLSTCMQTSQVNVENKLHDEQVQTKCSETQVYNALCSAH
jgi:hypothetical protein